MRNGHTFPHDGGHHDGNAIVGLFWGTLFSLPCWLLLALLVCTTHLVHCHC